jgi:pilus assembly protein FimV
VANAEVRRQTDEWQNRSQGPGQLRLLPPEEAAVARVPAPAPVQPSPDAAASQAAAAAAAASAAAAAEESRRLLALRDEELRNLQQQAAAAEPTPPPANEPQVAPGVDLEVEAEPLFADEAEAPAPAPAEAAPTPVVAPAPAAGPSLTARVLGWVMSPVLWIGLGVGALLLTALWFVRRRRQEPEDVTGRWEALESEVDDDEVREATARMRAQVRDESIVVEEAQAERPRRGQADVEPETRRAPARPQRAERAASPERATSPSDETLSSQTVINLDQADPVAEADFHMAYGLYDQAAELVQKALEAAPGRRDLTLKLLEVFFVWGNKESFLKAAQSLRKELGQRPDADWDKVVIMGKQICPDERLFAEATMVPGQIDVDLEAGDSPLDLAFDEVSAGDMDLDLSDSGGSLDFDLEASAIRAPAPKSTSRPAAKSDLRDDSLDIGARTAAGLEAAFFLDDDEEREAAGDQTTPDLAADSLAITQESPTIERSSGGRDWSSANADSPTVEYAAVDAPTVETPTIESPGPDSPTMETLTVETPFGGPESPTMEQIGIAGNDLTAEINLDDLGLDLNDLEELPTDLGDLPLAADGETDTREQPVCGEEYEKQGHGW